VRAAGVGVMRGAGCFGWLDTATWFIAEGEIR